MMQLTSILQRNERLFALSFVFVIGLLMISIPNVLAQPPDDAPGTDGPAVEDRGPPAFAGKPDDVGKPDDAPGTDGPAVEDRGPPAFAGKPDDVGKPDKSDVKRDDTKGKPDSEKTFSFGGTLESASTFGIMDSDGATSTMGKQGYAYGFKAVGTGLTVINSDKICGLSLCSEKMSTAEIIQQYLQSKGLD